MINYSKSDIGTLIHIFNLEGLPQPLKGKNFLCDLFNLNAMEVSLNKNTPDTGADFLHSQKNKEEVYIFLTGTGEMVIDDEKFPVKEGTVVRVAADADRAWWNTGDTDLYYIVIQAPYKALDAAAPDNTDIPDKRLAGFNFQKTEDR